MALVDLSLDTRFRAAAEPIRSVPSGDAAMSTKGAGPGFPLVEPWNLASPKMKTPPSAAASR